LKIGIFNLNELSDGVVWFKILHEINPIIWREEDMDLEDPDTIEVKIKNVGHLFKGMQEFYKAKLNIELNEDEFDIEAI